MTEDEILRRQCETILQFISQNGWNWDNGKVNALMTFAKRMQAVGLQEAADEFENNYDGGNPRYGNPKFVTWLRQQINEREG
jgi:hypothetical protein